MRARRLVLGLGSVLAAGGAAIAPITAEAAPQPPTITQPSVVEGDADLAVAPLVVSLPTPATVPVVFAYRTMDGTAKAEQDYETASGVVIIKQGERSATVEVRVAADTVPEADETFDILVTAPAVGFSGVVRPVILDDDRPRRVTLGPAGEEADGDSGLPTAMTPDNRYLVFSTLAGNLVPGASQGPGGVDGTGDVVRVDLVTGRIDKVGVTVDGQDPNAGTAGASISADGRIVAFYSRAHHLVPGDDDLNYDVFARDLLTGVTERLTRSYDGEPLDGSSHGTSMSADGRFVAFTSRATNLVPSDDNRASDVFVHDRLLDKTEMVSVWSDGRQITGDSGIGYNPKISADGRYVLFEAPVGPVADEVRQTGLLRRDRLTGTTEIVNTDASGAWLPGSSVDGAMDASGERIAFVRYVGGDDPGPRFSVYVKDMRTGAVELASGVTRTRPSNGSSQRPTISLDGTIVTFESEASDLVPGDTNGALDAFARDLVTGRTTRITTGIGGSNPDDASSTATASDARIAAFQSYASNIVPGDTNGVGDVFVRRTGLVPALTVGDAILPVGLASPAPVAVPVTLSAKVATDVDVAYRTSDGRSGTVRIRAGQRNASLVIVTARPVTIDVEATSVVVERGRGAITTA